MNECERHVAITNKLTGNSTEIDKEVFWENYITKYAI